MPRLMIRALVLLLAGCAAAAAQDKGTLDPKPLPPLEKPDDPNTPAKELFGRKPKPAPLVARAIGYYTGGCLAGGIALPINGKTWQVMRLSRNRNWGHPNLVKFLERLAEKAPKVGWNGLLVGDMAQPRGGPMLTGHDSHQLGLEADIWLTHPPADRLLTAEEREEMSAIDMVRPDLLDVNADFTPAHLALMRRAALMPDVDRIFVNAAIKRAACRDATGERGWLRKLRPWPGHTYHFHVALKCPNAGCAARNPVPPGEGCGRELDQWFRAEVRFPKPSIRPPRILKLNDLPKACRDVLAAP